MVQPLFVFSEWALLVLRVVMGAILIAHGFPKLKDLRGTGGSFAGMGFKPGMFWTTVVAILEFVGGIFLIVGFLTQVVGLLLAIQFIVIILKLKRRSGLVGGFEFDLLLAASALALATLGGGYYSLDDALGFIVY